MDDKGKKHRVVIVGGGFGGLWATTHLKRAPIEITLIDRRNFHLFQPLLYQVATGGLSPADIASPLRGVLTRQKNVKVELGDMIDLDYENRRVILKDRNIPFDTLVVAVGTSNHYYGHKQWAHFAPGLKGIEDALTIRNRIFSAFEAAEKEMAPERRRRLMTFVIVGGGPTGVELAGAISEIANITLKNDFRSINTSDAKIILIEGGPRILPSFPESLAKAAERSLSRLNVEVRSGLLADGIDASGVTAKGPDGRLEIESHTVMWAAGVRPSGLGKKIVADQSHLDREGRVSVEADLTVPTRPEVYVIGDLANVKDDSGEPLPGIAPVAMSEGKYVAKTIVRKIMGKQVKRYTYFNRGNMAVIGRASAVADLGWARFSGYPAWLLWLFVHLMYLVGFDNRLLVFIQWAWNYFTRNRSARLITYCLNEPDSPQEVVSRSE